MKTRFGDEATDILWKDHEGQWWYFTGVESILLNFCPSRNGRPARLECNTGQELIGRKVNEPHLP
jgi:hypothetical protein